MAHVVELVQCEPEEAQDDAGSEYDDVPALVYTSDDEDSNMQGNARPVGVRRFPQAVVDGHEARAQAVQLQE